MATQYLAGQLLVGVKPDASGAAKRVRNEFDSMPDPVVKLDADIRSVEKAKAKAQAELDTLKARPAKLDLDIQEMEGKAAQARARLDDLRSRPVTPKVEADIQVAEARLARVDQRLEQLRSARADPKLTADTASAEARVAGLGARLDQLTAQRRDIRPDVDDSAAAGGLSRLTGRVSGAVSGLGSTIRSKLGSSLGDAVGGDLGAGIADGMAGKAMLAAGAGLAIGAAVSKAVGAAIDIDVGRSKLQAQLGLTAEDSQRYGKVAGSLYSQAYGEDLNQVNDALRAVTLNIAGTTQASSADLERVSGKVLNLADAFDVDLQGASAAVGTMLKNGLAPNADAALDIVTAGFQNGADKAGDFLDTLTEYSGQFGKFGLDGATATGLLTQGLRAGARDADYVADAIKEFSIRAIDGSESTAEGFAKVGLNAGDMAAKIARGGPEAAGALDLTLDRLRAMPDPVQRSQAAVALFGTKAEDLGQALFALDPSAATGALGQVGGAADRMGQALTDNSATRIEMFKRSIMNGLVTVIGGAVLPALDAVTSFLAGVFGPAWGPIVDVLGFIAGYGGVVVAVLGAVALATWAWTTASAALAGTWLANPITWIVVAIIGLIGLVVWAYNRFEWFRNLVSGVWNVVAAGATWLWTSVFSPVFSFIGGIVMWLWTSVISPVVGWIASQWSWLSVVLGVLVGPIGWVVLAFTTFRDQTMAVLSAVGAVLLWLWQAVVVPAWTAIAAVVSWAWTTIIWPVLSALGTALRILAAVLFTVVVTPFLIAWNLISMAVSWAWTSVIAPVLGFIWTGLRFLGAIIFTVLVTPFLIAWNLISMAAQWAWTNVISPVLGFIWQGLQFLGSIISVVLVAPFQVAWAIIGAVISFAWNAVILPVWNALVAFAQNIIMPMLMFLWQGVVVPVWNAIGAVISFAWNSVILPIWSALVGFLNVVVIPLMRFLYDSVILPVWNAIGAVISFIWNSVIRPAWDALVGFINGVLVPLMRFLYDSVIRPVWDAIGAAISFIWNSVILPVWNALVGFVNSILIPMMRFLYEQVIKPVWDAIGAAISFVWNSVIKPAWDAVAAGLMWLGDRFRDGVNLIGQLWAGIKGMLAKPINFMIDVVWNRGVVPAWNKVAQLVGLGPIQPLGLIPEFAAGGSPVDVRPGGQVRGPGTGTSDSIVARLSNREFVVREKVASRVPHFLRALNDGQPEAIMAAGGTGARMPGYAAGGAVEAAINFARGESGKPYQWAGVGNPSWDCSGFMSGITNVLRGQNPRRRIGATGSFPWPGFRPGLSSAFSIGSTRNAGNGIGHMAGTLAGNNVESGGSNGVRFGPPAIGADNGLFNQRYHLPEVGGVFASGGAGGGGGGIFDFISPMIRAAFDALTNPAIDLVRNVVGAPPPEWRAVPPAFATKARDSLREFMLSKVSQFLGSGDDAASGPLGRGAPFHIKQISDAARMLGLGRDAAIMGVATALVETGSIRMLANPRRPDSMALPHEGLAQDHDSVGLFQQRANGEWGSTAQQMNALASSIMFFRAMLRIVGPGWRANLGEAAARTQRPAAQYRGRYAAQMGRAAGLVDQFGGPFDEGGVARGMGWLAKATRYDERVLDPIETRQYDTLGPLVREMEAARLPVQNAPSMTAAQIAALGAAPTTFPSSFRLSSDTALRLDGDGVLHIVDGRLDALADALDAGRTD